MNILFLETHYKTPKGDIRTSAVDHWRILNPAKHLRKARPNWRIDVKKELFPDTANQMEVMSEYERIGREYDIVYTSYFIRTDPYAYFKILQEKMGVNLVMDMDDDIFNIAPYNHVYNEMYGDPMKIPLFKSFLEQHDYMTVTTKPIKSSLKKESGHSRKLDISIIPNYIDLELYKKQEKVEDDVVTIVYQGGSTHIGDILYNDFFAAISYILGKYKGKVRFEMFGVMKGLPYESLPYTTYIGGCNDYLEYVSTFLEKSKHWDIGVAPLENIEFNESKSFIKPMEYGSQGISVVVSDYGSYRGFIDHGVNGYKARTTKDWIDYLSLLIDRKSKRKEIGQKLYKDIKENYTIDHNISKYINLFERIK